MSRKRVTIKQVAHEAGVSTQTVSRVVNHRPDVADDTREHVQSIIDQMGYQPSRIARSLSRGRSYTLGIVAFGLGLFGPSQTFYGIQEEANSRGYSLIPHILANPEEYDADELLRETLSYHVDGIIWAVPEIGQNRDWIPNLLEDIQVPVVFLNAQPRPQLTTVAINNRSGGRLAARHLLEQKRQHIGLITGPLSWWEARQRELGWREEITASGRVVDESYIAQGDWTAASGERCMRSLLQWHPEMDAVFVSNDQMALGAMKAASQAGRRIPQDLALVGFDDIPESAYFTPGLTTVRQDMAAIGREGVLRLIALLQEPDQKEVSETVMVQPQLIRRESA